MYLRGPSAHRRRNAFIAGTALVAFVALGALWLGSRFESGPEPARRQMDGMLTLDAARDFTAYRVYWLGEDPGDLSLFALRHEQRPALTTAGGDRLLPGAESVSVAYYECGGHSQNPRGVCHVALQVTTEPACGAGAAFEQPASGPGAIVDVDSRRIRVHTGKVLVTIIGYQHASGFSAEDLVATLEPLNNNVDAADRLPPPSVVDDCTGPWQTSRAVTGTDLLGGLFARPIESEIPLAGLAGFEPFPLVWLGPGYDGFHLTAAFTELAADGRFIRTATLRYGSCDGAWAAAAYPACPAAADVVVGPFFEAPLKGARCERLPSGAIYRYRPGRLRIWTGGISILIRDASLTDPADVPGLISKIVPLSDSARTLTTLPAPDRDPCPPTKS